MQKRKREREREITREDGYYVQIKYTRFVQEYVGECRRSIRFGINYVNIHSTCIFQIYEPLKITLPLRCYRKIYEFNVMDVDERS